MSKVSSLTELQTPIPLGGGSMGANNSLWESTSPIALDLTYWHNESEEWGIVVTVYQAAGIIQFVSLFPLGIKNY